jgi:hypothetical protein
MNSFVAKLCIILIYDLATFTIYFYTCKCIVRVGMWYGLMGALSRKEGGIQVLDGQGPSSQSRILIENPMLSRKAAESHINNT